MNGFTDSEMNETVKDLYRATNGACLYEKKKWGSLFGGTPRYSNLFYVIVEMYHRPVPEWFFKKYAYPGSEEEWRSRSDKKYDPYDDSTYENLEETEFLEVPE